MSRNWKGWLATATFWGIVTAAVWVMIVASIELAEALQRFAV